MSGETFTLNSDDFETTRYLGPQWQEGARKPVKLVIKWPDTFCPMPIVTRMTSGTVDVRISDAAQR